MGRQGSGAATDAEVAAARQAKDAETDFRSADAHWALVNGVNGSGQIVLADSFEDVWGAGHGYEATFAVEKLTAANLALDGCFDWSGFMDEQGRAWGIDDMRGRAYAPSTPRLKNPARLEAILRNNGREVLDLAGRVVRSRWMWSSALPWPRGIQRRSTPMPDSSREKREVLPGSWRTAREIFVIFIEIKCSTFCLTEYTAMPYTLSMIFIETSAFTRLIYDYMSEEEYLGLQSYLLQRPGAGSIVPGSGGVRKLRWSMEGRGKRGGSRVIYYWSRQMTRFGF